MATSTANSTMLPPIINPKWLRARRFMIAAGGGATTSNPSDSVRVAEPPSKVTSWVVVMAG